MKRLYGAFLVYIFVRSTKPQPRVPQPSAKIDYRSFSFAIGKVREIYADTRCGCDLSEMAVKHHDILCNKFVGVAHFENLLSLKNCWKIGREWTSSNWQH